MSIVGNIDQISPDMASGWAADRRDFTHKVLVLLVRDGRILDTALADTFRPDLKLAGFGDGYHAFAFRFADRDDSEDGSTELYATTFAEARALGLLSEQGIPRKDLDTEDFRDLRKRAGSPIERLLKDGRGGSAGYVQRYKRSSDQPINLLDIVDLLTFFTVHNRVTGIQRVVSNLISTTLSDTSRYGAFEFCFSTHDDDLLVLPRDELTSIIGRILAGDITQPDLVERIAKLKQNAQLISLKRGDRFIITGAYWIVSDFGPKLLRLKAKGVVTGAYIYDLIPITASQYVTDATRQGVIERGIEVLSVCDFFMTISDFVAGEVRELLDHELGQQAPTRTVPLPHEIPFQASTTNPPPRLYPRPFVLCVGTFEGRKNHKLLFHVWAGLIRKHGHDAVPDLVLVGKWGWRIEEFRALCIESGFLSNKLFLMEGITDAELSVLYRDCVFTVFPSFVEGWGLPVGESLAAGKFCIASDASSIPEVGGAFVDYISPHDYFQALRVIERAVLDPQYVIEREHNIRDHFQARTWRDTTALFHAAIDDLASAAPTKQPRIPTLSPGSFYAVALATGVLVTWRSREIKFILTAGWHPLEPDGVWGSAPRSQLRFFSGLSTGDSIRVFLELKLPPGSTQSSVQVRDGAGQMSWSALSGAKSNLVEVDTMVGAEGVIDLSIQLLRFHPHTDDQRKLYVGLTGIAYAERGNTAQYVTILSELADSRAALSAELPVPDPVPTTSDRRNGRDQGP